MQSVAACPNKHTVQVGDYLYRVVDLAIASCVDEYDIPIGPGRIELHLCRYKVTATRCGAWIEGRRASSTWGTTRNTPCPLRRTPWLPFRKRKNRQLQILKTQTDRAMVARGMAADVRNILGWDEK